MHAVPAFFEGLSNKLISHYSFRLHLSGQAVDKPPLAEVLCAQRIDIMIWIVSMPTIQLPLIEPFGKIRVFKV